MPNTVVLFSEDPSFFERTDVSFNRRGVDVFATMEMQEFAAVLSSVPVKLVIARGAPGGLPEPSLRSRLGSSPHILVLGTPDDDSMVLRSYQKGMGSTVLMEPYGARVFEIATKLLEVPVRHYVRMLIQIKGGPEGAAGFGYCQNVSTTGMLIETKRELTVGGTLRLSFLVPNTAGMIEVTARIVRHAGSLKEAHRYGLHFLDLATDDQAKIAELSSVRPPARSISSPGRAGLGRDAPSGSFL